MADPSRTASVGDGLDGLKRVGLPASAHQRRVPRVALSATLGDMRLAAEALRPGAGDAVVLIKGEGDGRGLRIQLRGYRSRPPAPGMPAQAPNDEGDATSRLVADLYKALRGQDNLVFANSRSRVEQLTDYLRVLSERTRVPNEFFAHHGNLSREIREEAEARVKNASKPTSVVCTSTLELGIDIGSVASIAQVGAPPSVTVLRQRLGRSGRRADESAVLRGFIIEEELHKRCFRHQLLLPRPYLVLTKPLRLDIQCQRGASVKIGWKYLDD